MDVKVSELSGAALDWAVAKVEDMLDRWGRCAPVGFKPSTDWAQGGPIIERERISTRTHAEPGFNWVAFIDFGGSSVSGAKARMTGPTALIAAMRCFVASKLGDVVSIPDELL